MCELSDVPYLPSVGGKVKVIYQEIFVLAVLLEFIRWCIGGNIFSLRPKERERRSGSERWRRGNGAKQRKKGERE